MSNPLRKKQHIRDNFGMLKENTFRKSQLFLVWC